MPEWLISMLVLSGSGIVVTFGISIINRYMPRQKAIALGSALGNKIAEISHATMKACKYLNDKSIELIEEGPYDTFWLFVIALGTRSYDRIDELRKRDGIKEVVDPMGDTRIVDSEGVKNANP